MLIIVNLICYTHIVDSFVHMFRQQSTQSSATDCLTFLRPVYMNRVLQICLSFCHKEKTHSYEKIEILSNGHGSFQNNGCLESSEQSAVQI